MSRQILSLGMKRLCTRPRSEVLLLQRDSRDTPAVQELSIQPERHHLPISNCSPLRPDCKCAGLSDLPVGWSTLRRRKRVIDSYVCLIYVLFWHLICTHFIQLLLPFCWLGKWGSEKWVVLFQDYTMVISGENTIWKFCNFPKFYHSEIKWGSKHLVFFQILHSLWFHSGLGGAYQHLWVSQTIPESIKNATNPSLNDSWDPTYIFIGCI